MEILEYDEVDPLDVLHLNLLCLDFALTPELVGMIRRMDPRPFPFFALYASVNGVVAGQVGVFRLPVVSTEGANEVGGVWAVSTHPAYERRGIASRLLEEAHTRMRAAGLRYSTLGTDRYRTAHQLYRKLGYVDVHASDCVLVSRDALPEPAGLRAQRAGDEGLSLADQLFEKIANNRLGFARRHVPFFAFLDRRGYLKAKDLWILWQGNVPVGYAAVFGSERVSTIASLLVVEQIDPASAVAAIAAGVDTPYLQVRIDRPTIGLFSVRSNARRATPTWGTFMVKPLDGYSSIARFRSLYGVGTDRFQISYMDVT